jgi:hypothetical protein
MRLQVIPLAILASVSLLAADPVNADERIAKIAKDSLGSVATLIALDSNKQPLALGTGFFLDAAGSLVTAAHVVEGAAEVVVRWKGKNGTASEILRFDPKFDLIILKTSFSSTPAVVLGDSELVTIGEGVVVLSNPQGLEGTVSQGILSGVRNLDGVKYLQITAAVSPGSSGGPVFNLSGRVIGVANATLASGQSLNFALPSNLIKSLPSSPYAFKQIAVNRQKPAGIESGTNLVHASHVKPEFAGNDLFDVAFSVQNKTNDLIGAFKLLLVFYDNYREPLSYRFLETKETIPPGLAKQFQVEARIRGFGRQEADRRIEIRILDYKIIRRGG